MNVQPSKHLILINGHTHQGPWFDGNTHLSFANPFTLSNAGEIILITKLLILPTVYGNTTISWEAQIELLSLVPDHILMRLLI